MIYLHTSALLKLVREEEHSDAFRTYLTQRPDPAVSSVLLAIETRRAVQRNTPELLPRADLVLGRVNLVGLNDAVVESAGRLPDPGLRSLDAIHVATALLLGDEVSVLVAYDKRMVAAAEAQGLPVATPT